MTDYKSASAMDREIIGNRSRWPGETICIKKYPRGDEPTGFMGYAAFGVMTSLRLPIIIFLRGDTEADDFKTTIEYPSLDAMFDAGWVAD
jgi:hypothetical protein